MGGEFHEGDEAFISLKYEKLFSFCEHCFSLSHGLDDCPLITRSPQKKKEVGENPISRHDDLARSYKGVVINGATDQQGQGRENRDYTGKGKEKMYEEHESKWVKVPEKGGNRYHSYRTNHRGDNGGQRHRSSRFDRSRGYNAEENPRFPREVRRGMSP